MRQQHHHQERGAWMIKLLIYALCVSEQAHQPSIPSMLRCLAVIAMGGSIWTSKIWSEVVSCLSGSMVSGNNKALYGTVCLSSPFCIALRPFHWTAAGPKGSIFTTHYIIIYATCVSTGTPLRVETLPHSAQLRVGKLEGKKPTWICQKFCHATFFLSFFSSRVALINMGLLKIERKWSLMLMHLRQTRTAA